MSMYYPGNDDLLERKIAAMTREEMEQFCEDTDFDYIMQTSNGQELLRDYLRMGFKGYENFSDAELRLEVHQRSLS